MNVRTLLAAAILGAATLPVMAQEQPANPGANNNNNGGNRQRGNQDGGGGGRGNWDPAQMQQRMMDGIKERLKVPDDEWKVIQPKLEKVMTAQRDLRGPGGFGGRNRGGPGGPGGPGGEQPQPTTEIGIASRDLRTAVEAENTSPEEIDKKLAAFRAARDKATATLEAARKDLKEVLSARQEAALVLSGTLE